MIFFERQRKEINPSQKNHQPYMLNTMSIIQLVYSSNFHHIGSMPTM